jgi:tungstate transport system ATP-binding protein
MNPKPDHLLSLQDVGVRFGKLTALQAVTLDLRRGERLALVGANGSGKSTLLRALHGLVAVSGVRQLAPSGKPLVMAMLFQKPFMLDLSVRRNVLLGLWLRHVPKAERAARCDLALQRMGLSALAERSARSLSGGQQQRLALARAWALAPDVLLLDEPTASLDPSGKREVELLIEELAAEGMTLVFSTHNLGQAKRLATRVVYLDAGSVVVDLPAALFFNGELPEQARLFVKGEMTWI